MFAACASTTADQPSGGVTSTGAAEAGSVPESPTEATAAGAAAPVTPPPAMTVEPVADAAEPPDEMDFDGLDKPALPPHPASSPYPDQRGKCAIDSGYPGDDACLLPPDPSEGFQIHVGPKDYANAEEVAPYLLPPGEETSLCWTFKTPNTEKAIYQSYELSGRAGTHHIINTMFGVELAETGEFTICAYDNIVGSLPVAAKPYMPRAVVAPEDAHIGREIPAGISAQSDMHYYNFTDAPILREFWMNFYYAEDPAAVTETVEQLRGYGGLAWLSEPIQPGTDQVYQYSCPIIGDGSGEPGRILSLLGHYHAYGVRFSASLERAADGSRQKVFEMYDYQDPVSFEYNSVVSNPAFSDTAAGATSGPLMVNDGDVLHWECHIINDSEFQLRYINSVFEGEMCNIWGTTVGVERFSCNRL